MNDRELMQQALIALEVGGWNMTTRAIIALRERLAQPAQEPVAAECKFEREEKWERCEIAHHNLVQSEPHKWPGYQTRLLYTRPQAREPEQTPWCPDVCPITGLPFFMWIEHHETGQRVPTYGGPYDSYTIPVRDKDGSYYRERYDHDRGGWLTDEVEDVGVQIVSDQAFVYDEERPQAREPLEPVEGDLLPAIGSKVLIHLASQDQWVEHTVAGYYVWGDLDGRENRRHRVFVRVVDADGILNARMLCDVRPIEAAHGIGEKK